MSDSEKDKPQESEEKLAERLEHAYEKMLERVRDALEEFDDQARPRLRQAVARARERAVELGELSREEAEHIGEYIRRDLSEAGDFLSRTGRELRDWLRFDIELLEARFLDMLMGAADRTRSEIAAMRETGTISFRYHTGEIAGPGTLYCENCEHPLTLKRTGHIPPCSECHGTRFHRPRRAG
jgi:hypothetical protein